MEAKEMTNSLYITDNVRIEKVTNGWVVSVAPGVNFVVEKIEGRDNFAVVLGYLEGCLDK